jgi:D-3-phosphoglycerate dehydrogenase / 2-oxoglutarate reductase
MIGFPSMWRVLVTDEMRLSEINNAEVRLDYKPGMPREEILAAIGQYDALITRSRTQVDAALLDAGTKLKVVGRGGVGVDNVDIEAASRRGILVVNVPEANTRSAAELAWALLLASARGVVDSDRKVRMGQWDRKYLGLELDKRVLGVIGLGRIGGQVAKFGKAFDMRILAYDPYIPQSRAQTLGVELVDNLTDLLRQSQFLTVHTPLNEETKGMIGRRELYLLPKGAVVVNAARGGIIDEKALLEVVEDHLWGAGLDVFVQEPPGAEHPLVNHPKVIHTAHLGANTLEAQDRVGEAVLERVIETLGGNLAHALNTGFNAEALEAFSAWLPLGESLGKLLAQITQGRPQSVEVGFYGDFDKNPDPIAAAVAKGLLNQFLEEGATNLVSAKPLLRDRGMSLTTRSTEKPLDYRQVIEVSLETDKETRKVRGAVLGGKPRIVGIDDHTVEAVPQGFMLVCINRDQPGVVGKVGTLLGEAKVNIAGMQLGRDNPGGHALFVLAVDGRPDETILGTLRSLDVLERVDLALL